ncbi:MAG TPA: alpha/beta hydrolase [Bryobacteraceae bacterium]|nr:alpha/beta hydrolase [Bryobacteraceae bacterium]
MVSIVLLSLFAAGGLFDYDTSKPLDIKVSSTETRNEIEVQDITFANVAGGRTPAYLVFPQQKTKRAAILFVHWYEPPNPTSNRTQFVDEAVELARAGVISLIPATMWSEPKWFNQRNRRDDLHNSVLQVKELRRALDVLLTQPGIDKDRVALVGHDFGAMFGAVFANVDRRPNIYALQAGTGRFYHWYLYGPPMPEPERLVFIESLKAIDPVEHIGKAGNVPILFQFATRDKHVPKERAEEFFSAAGAGKTLLWYEAGHGLDEKAKRDRIDWLKKVLRLK